MKIMFVSGGFENLGIEYLSAVLKKHGFQTRLAFDPQLFNDPFLKIEPLGKFFNYQQCLLKQIEEFNPKIVAFPVVSADYRKALNLAAKIKSFSSAHITFGGIHPTSVPDRVILQDCVDSVIIGEGEFALLELANSIKTGEIDYTIKNIWFKKNGHIIKNPTRPYIENLDSLPFPDKELYYQQIPEYRRGYTVITRRGCLNSCSYCYNSVIDNIYSKEHKRIRMRSVDNVIEELKQAKEKYGFKLLRVNDDLFTYDKKWLGNFCSSYKKHINVPLYCFGSPSTIDEEVAAYLKELGCYQLCLGVQSVDPKVRRDIFHRYENNEKIINAITLLRKYKIRVVADNIIGYPGEKEEDLLKIARFYNRYRPDRICIFWLIYYPRTAIVNIAKEMGVLNQEDIDRLENTPYDTANTLYNTAHTKQKKKYHLFLVLLNLLPQKLYSWILKHRLYRFLPIINPALIEYPYTIFARDRLDIPRRRYYIRYFKFMPSILCKKLKI